jgi:hypothetical protein
MTKKKKTFFNCSVCGKITTGRLPRLSKGMWSGDNLHVGDGTMRYPRRHKGPDGQPCPGNIEKAKWVDL